MMTTTGGIGPIGRIGAPWTWPVECRWPIEVG